MSKISRLSPASAEQLCAELQRFLRQTLGPAAGRALDAFDAALFDRASHARGALEEQRLLDALRELRRKRSSVESAFLTCLGADLVPRHLQKKAGKPRQGLSLFPRDELEEKLTISSLALTANVRVREQLAALNRRLEALLDVAPVSDESNVIGPLALAEQFKDALGPVDIATDLRLLAYRQLQSNVFESLSVCYRACNKLLIEGGVLPVLPDIELAPIPAPPAKLDRRRAKAAPLSSHPVQSAQPASQPGSAPGPGAIQPAAAAVSDRETSELAALYQEMMSQRTQRPRPPQASLRGRGGLGEASRAMLLDAATKLLHLPDADVDADDLKQRLLNLVREGSSAEASISPEVEGTVDLVESLFTRMRNDQVLPAPLASVMNALRVPFLHAALRDEALLTDPEHPAVQLIDEFGDTARGWCPSADPGHRLLRQMDAVQSVLAARCERNGDGFNEALYQFREFMLTHSAQAAQAEQRVIESARSRESLHQAQVEARLTLESHMAGFQPSAWLRQLLLKHWAAYMVLILLRHGPVSDYYRLAVAFADSLLKGERDSSNPIHAGSFRARQGELETVLRQGLATLAYTDEEIQRLCAGLGYFVRQGARDAQPAPQAESPPARELAEQPRAGTIDPSVMRHLRGLRPGTWFELGKEQGETTAESERGRLCWISPISGRWMLVNWSGRKIADLPPEKIAEDIARGLARVIGDSNVLRRAVQSVMDELNSESNTDVGRDLAS